MSSGRVRLKLPRNDLASPVRTLSMMTTSRMGDLLYRLGAKASTRAVSGVYRKQKGDARVMFCETCSGETKEKRPGISIAWAQRRGGVEGSRERGDGESEEAGQELSKASHGDALAFQVGQCRPPF